MRGVKLKRLPANREWLEVRCCCRPEKLLGWLPVPKFGNPVVVGSTKLWVHEIKHDDGSWTAIKAEGAPVPKLRRIPGFVERR